MITAWEARELMNHFDKEKTFRRIEKAISTAALNNQSYTTITLNELECRDYRDISARLLANRFSYHLESSTKELHIKW